MRHASILICLSADLREMSCSPHSEKNWQFRAAWQMFSLIHPNNVYTETDLTPVFCVLSLTIHSSSPLGSPCCCWPWGAVCYGCGFVLFSSKSRSIQKLAGGTAAFRGQQDSNSFLFSYLDIKLEGTGRDYSTLHKLHKSCAPRPVFLPL